MINLEILLGLCCIALFLLAVQRQSQVAKLRDALESALSYIERLEQVVEDRFAGEGEMRYDNNVEWRNEDGPAW